MSINWHHILELALGTLFGDICAILIAEVAIRNYLKHHHIKLNKKNELEITEDNNETSST